MSQIEQVEPLTVLLGGLALGAVNSLHCVGMCGPLVAATHGGLRSGVGYHIARTTAYTAIGVLAGGFGAAVGIDAIGPAGAAFAFALAGAMLLAALGGERFLSGIPMLGSVVARIHRQLVALPPGLRGVAVGLLTPLLPCGLLWAACAVAVAAGWHGWAAMLGFAVGGLPALALAHWNFARIRSRLGAARTRQVARAALVVAAGALAWRGWAQVAEGVACCAHAP